jgi:hypothetical protein
VRLHGVDRQAQLIADFRLVRPSPGEPVGLAYTIVAATCYFSQHVKPLDSDLVLVRESAEDLFAADPVLGRVMGFGGPVSA